MAQRTGSDRPTGSAESDGENEQRHTVDALQRELKSAQAAARDAQQDFETQTRRVADLAIRLERAKSAQMQAEILGAAQVTRSEIDRAIDRARQDILSGAGILVELGDSKGWGRWLEPQMQKARDAVTGGQLPAVVVVRGCDATSHQRAPGVALLIDLTGRLPQPQSTLTAAETARRANARSGRL